MTSDETGRRPRVLRADVSLLLTNTYGGYLAAKTDPQWRLKLAAAIENLLDRLERLKLLEPDGDYVGRLMTETQKRGVITVSCGLYHNVLRHLTPLVIGDAQLDEALDVLADSAVAARG